MNKQRAEEENIDEFDWANYVDGSWWSSNFEDFIKSVSRVQRVLERSVSLELIMKNSVKEYPVR